MYNTCSMPTPHAEMCMHNCHTLSTVTNIPVAPSAMTLVLYSTVNVFSISFPISTQTSAVPESSSTTIPGALISGAVECI